MKSSPIGIFDSGVGGLSILEAVHRQLPNEDIIFVADQAHVPYGTRSIDVVCQYSVGITNYLLANGVKVIVVACNTASAAALHFLRNQFPQTPFVGMEPAVKPAAESTNTGVVGVLATPATFQGELYASVVERFANGVSLHQDTCPGLVMQIEKGDLETSETREILEGALRPMLDNGVDRIVLGCTHYPFVIPVIKDIVGSNVPVIDPAPAVARQTARVLKDKAGLVDRLEMGTIKVLTTGDPRIFNTISMKLSRQFNNAEQLYWHNDSLVSPK